MVHVRLREFAWSFAGTLVLALAMLVFNRPAPEYFAFGLFAALVSPLGMMYVMAATGTLELLFLVGDLVGGLVWLLKGRPAGRAAERPREPGLLWSIAWGLASGAVVAVLLYGGFVLSRWR